MAASIQIARADLRTKWRWHASPVAVWTLAGSGTRRLQTDSSPRRPSLTNTEHRINISKKLNQHSRLLNTPFPHSKLSIQAPSSQLRPITSVITSRQTHRKQLLQTHPFRKASSTPNPPTPPTPPNPPDQTKPTTKLRQHLQSLTPTPHENIYTVPNILTFTRLLSAPLIGYLLINSQPALALTLFFYAALTDLLDGYLARRFHTQTVVGTVIDPMADKTLMTICVAALGYTGQFPWWLVLVILGRDVGLAISAIYFRYISLPPPKTMARYWDFSLPSAEVRPTEISKINTLLQLLLVGDALVLPVLPAGLVEVWNLTGVLQGWEVLVAVTTVWSGLSYVGNKDAVKILSQEEREEKMEMLEKGTQAKGEEREG